MSVASWVALRMGKKPKHIPYMVLPDGGSGPFSCKNCKALDVKGGEYHCKNPSYAKYMGTTLLVEEDGTPLDDPSRACSDWFEPATVARATGGNP